MQITPVIKGQITKAIKAHSGSNLQTFYAIKSVLMKYMPREQAKHAAKRYLAAK